MAEAFRLQALTGCEQRLPGQGREGLVTDCTEGRYVVGRLVDTERNTRPTRRASCCRVAYLLVQALNKARLPLDLARSLPPPRSGGFWIDTVLIEQVDAIGPQPLQRCVGDLPVVFWPAVQAEPLKLPAEWVADLGCDHHLVAERGQRFAHNLLVPAGS